MTFWVHTVNQSISQKDLLFVLSWLCKISQIDSAVPKISLGVSLVNDSEKLRLLGFISAIVCIPFEECFHFNFLVEFGKPATINPDLLGLKLVLPSDILKSAFLVLELLWALNEDNGVECDEEFEILVAHI